jgi:hypothetical protein
VAKKTPHKIMYIRAAPDIEKAVKDLAVEENRSVSNMVETILRRYLEEKGKLPKENRLITVEGTQAA